MLDSMPEKNNTNIITRQMNNTITYLYDLKRAGIKPYAWLINQSLSMLSGISDPLLNSRATFEAEVINAIQSNHSERTFGIPFIAEKRLLPALLEKHAGVLRE